MISMLRGCRPSERTSLARLRVLLQHQHVHVVEPQLARQHHPGRTAPADDHLRHENPNSTNTYFGGQSQLARSRKAARRLRDQATAYHPAAEWGSCGKSPDGLYPGTSREKNLLAFLMCGARRTCTDAGTQATSLYPVERLIHRLEAAGCEPCRDQDVMTGADAGGMRNAVLRLLVAAAVVAGLVSGCTGAPSSSRHVRRSRLGRCGVSPGCGMCDRVRGSRGLAAGSLSVRLDPFGSVPGRLSLRVAVSDVAPRRAACWSS